MSISGLCSGAGGGLGSNSDCEDRADSGDGGSSDRPPRANGIGLTSKGVIGGRFMGLGVTSFSGPSGNPWVAITGNCPDVNVQYC